MKLVSELKNKICFVVPTLRKGGLERVVSLLSNNLISKANVYIITLTDDLVEYPIKNSVKLIHLNQNEKFNRFLLIKQLIKELRYIQPDITVGFSEVFNPVTIIAAKYLKLKVFVSDRSNPLLKHKVRDRLTRSITYPFADGMIAQTELAEKTFLKKKFNSNICVIPNPLIEFKNNNINSSSKYIITTGRLEKSKNQGELLDIFSKVVRDDWRLIIVGDGSYMNKLQEKAKQLHIANKVKFVGTQNDIEYWLNKGSIYAYTSLSEGFPNALNEALASPLATIAYDCPAGVSDLIEDNVNGFLIPLGNQKIYVEKLKILMESESKRKDFMKESIKLRRKYNSRIITSKLYEFITS